MPLLHKRKYAGYSRTMYKRRYAVKRTYRRRNTYKRKNYRRYKRCHNGTQRVRGLTKKCLPRDIAVEYREKLRALKHECVSCQHGSGTGVNHVPAVKGQTSIVHNVASAIHTEHQEKAGGLPKFEIGQNVGSKAGGIF